jgi:biopolymer transport protein ExbD
MARALLLAIVLSLTGCFEPTRPPVPVINIVVLEEGGTYLLDGEKVYLDELRNQVQDLADKYRRKLAGNARARVKVCHSAKVPYFRVQEVVGMCSDVGLDKATVEVRSQAK